MEFDGQEAPVKTKQEIKIDRYSVLKGKNYEVYNRAEEEREQARLDEAINLRFGKKPDPYKCPPPQECPWQKNYPMMDRFPDADVGNYQICRDDYPDKNMTKLRYRLKSDADLMKDLSRMSVITNLDRHVTTYKEQFAFRYPFTEDRREFRGKEDVRKKLNSIDVKTIADMDNSPIPIDKRVIDVSETREKFQPSLKPPEVKHRRTIITERFKCDPFVRANKPCFFYDDPYCVIRQNHPYMTTYRLNHRSFTEDIEKLKDIELHWMNSLKKETCTPLSVPMARLNVKQDVFEQSLVPEGRLPPRTPDNWYAKDSRNFNNLKLFFRKPVYTGTPPRCFNPLPGGLDSEYMAEYNVDFKPHSWFNHTRLFDQELPTPKETVLRRPDFRYPLMYKSENSGYGYQCYL